MEPTLDAPAHKAWAWTSGGASGGGLRYTWVMPPGIAQGEKRDLVVICHGAATDYRWGGEHHKPGEFRPRDFVVSVDGPSKGPDDTRLFLGRDEDISAFEAFLDEMKQVFPVGRVILYGYGQGASFVLSYVGEKGETVDGAVAHAAGRSGPAIDEFTLAVPIVLVHGTADGAVPYQECLEARARYLDGGHGKVALRRLPGAGHGPNAAVAAEAIDWCIGVTTTDAQEALAAAESMLRVKEAGPAPRFPPWFSGAAAILSRFRGQGVHPFAEGQTGGVEGRAIDLLRKVEAEAGRHASILKGELPSREALKLDGRPWLGHLVSVREDFRGIGPVETLATDLGYDELAAKHAEAAGELTRAWYQQASDKRIYETAVRVLPSCFLFEGLPVELSDFIPRAFEHAQDLRVSPEAVRRYRNFVMWKTGWDEGLKRYEAMCAEWK